MNAPMDMRSDVVTKPTPEMRRAMYEAEVGNDGAHEDPTTERLQELAAERLGKEAALFVTSGTQGNLLAVLSQVDGGGVIVTCGKCHVEYAERDGYRRIGGASLVQAPADRGVPLPAELRKALDEQRGLRSRTQLIWIENTHNLGGGTAVTSDRMAEVRALAGSFGLKVHVDGSRIFNAAAYLQVDVRELAKDADTVQFCLSKGLAAPIGSLLVGPAETIARAREFRQLLGGQMRQVGVIAAAGIVAIEKMSLRLHEDHENARLLAGGLAEISGIEIEPEQVQTNLVYCRVRPERGAAKDVLDALRERGVLAGGGGLGSQSIRFVLHYEVSSADVTRALKIIRAVMAAASPPPSPT